MINKKELSKRDLKYCDPYTFGYLKDLKDLKYGADICEAPPRPQDRPRSSLKLVTTNIACSG